MAITKGTYTAYASPAAAGATTIATSAFDSSGAGLLISAALFEGANTTASAADNKSNTWQTAVVTAFVNQFSVHCAMSWCVPTTVGTGHIVTWTFGASRTQRRACALNVNGTFSAVDALDVTPQQNDGNGDPVDAGSLVTSAATICVQAVGDNAAQTFTAGSGWTKDSATSGSHFQSRVEASSGTFDPVGSGIGYDWATVAMAFKETAGGATANPKGPINGIMLRGPLQRVVGF